MLKNPTKIRKLALAGMLVGLSIILAQLPRLEIPIGGVVGLKLSLAQLPVVFGSIVLGPLLGGIMAALSDLLTTLLGTTGAYQPLFTLSAAVFGLSLGLFLHRRTMPSLPRLLFSMFLTQLVTSTVMNTYFIHVLYGIPVEALLATRIPAMIADTLLLSGLCLPLLHLAARTKLLVFTPPHTT